jgi:hypothetical protein
MINTERALKCNWILKPLTGSSITNFQQILIFFKEVADEELTGKRKCLKGRKHSLQSLEDKLFFILFYINCYPTCELLAFLYGVHRSQICRWVKELESVLNKALGIKISLHKKPIKHFNELMKAYPEIKAIFIQEANNMEQSIKVPIKKKLVEYGKLVLIF